MWYRLYELDEADHILKATGLELPGDCEALAAALDSAALHGVEVWQGSRCVGRIASQDSEPVSARSA